MGIFKLEMCMNEMLVFKRKLPSLGLETEPFDYWKRKFQLLPSVTSC